MDMGRKSERIIKKKLKNNLFSLFCSSNTAQSRVSLLRHLSQTHTVFFILSYLHSLFCNSISAMIQTLFNSLFDHCASPTSSHSGWQALHTSRHEPSYFCLLFLVTSLFLVSLQQRKSSFSHSAGGKWSVGCLEAVSDLDPVFSSRHTMISPSVFIHVKHFHCFSRQSRGKHW